MVFFHHVQQRVEQSTLLLQHTITQSSVGTTSMSVKTAKYCPLHNVQPHSSGLSLLFPIHCCTWRYTLRLNFAAEDARGNAWGSTKDLLILTSRWTEELGDCWMSTEQFLVEENQGCFTTSDYFFLALPVPIYTSPLYLGPGNHQILLLVSLPYWLLTYLV